MLDKCKIFYCSLYTRPLAKISWIVDHCMEPHCKVRKADQMVFVFMPQGTADAVRQYMWLFEESTREGVEDYLILSGAT